jgi:hypothetical protein
MPVSSYPRVTVQGTGTAQNTQNGSALMVVNPSTGKYEAATAATFGGGGGGGDATAANQTSQINLATTLNGSVATAANQTSQTTALNAQSNGGVLVDTLATQVLTTSNVALTAIACKYVTLINLSTNAKFTFTIGANTLTLEPGYSVRLNVNNSGLIRIAQSTGEGQTAQIIITA